MRQNILKQKPLSELEKNMEVNDKNIKLIMLKAAEAAAKETLPLFRSALNVENKDEIGFDPVTIADQNAEKSIRDVISLSFPDHSIHGEELSDKITNSPYEWVVDPIDGTRAYISGLPTWGTLIGLKKHGKAIAGLMSQPYIGETYIATGKGSELIFKANISTLKVRKTTELSKAIMFTTTPKLFSTPKQITAFEKVEEKALLSRYGIDCYAYALLAAGQVDLVIEPDLKACDIAPLIAIVENAGGVISTWDRGRAENGGNIIASATPELLNEALEIMNEYLD
jgi:histidinol phosphatase-like enzyme (inositol monophosphatase family)